MHKLHTTIIIITIILAPTIWSNDYLTPTEPTITQEETTLIKQATNLYNQNHPQQAVTLLQQNITQKTSPAILFAIAAFQQKTNPKQAIKNLQTAIKKCPGFYRARINLAKLLLQQKQYQTASEHLKTLISQNIILKGETWQLLAYSYLQQNLPLAAELAYQQALILDPTNPAIRHNILKAKLDQNKLEETIPLIKQAIQTTPLNKKMWTLLINTELIQNHPQQALIHLECLRRLNLADTPTLITLADLLAQQQLPQQALTIYQQTAALTNPPIPRFLYAIQAYLANHQNQSAQKLLTQLQNKTNLTPKQQLQTKLLQAKIYQNSNHPQKALTLYQAILKKYPLNGKALLATGDLLANQHQTEKALILYERAANLTPPIKAQALIRQAQIAVSRKNYKHAINLLQQSLKIKEQKYIQQYLKQIQTLL